jgi:hypothetical protein
MLDFIRSHNFPMGNFYSVLVQESGNVMNRINAGLIRLGIDWESFGNLGIKNACNICAVKEFGFLAR